MPTRVKAMFVNRGSLEWSEYSSLHGLNGIGGNTISATGFQRKRRELREQTSVAARMNEEGNHDPYAKADANYDQVGVKDTGTEHQEGNPPPFSLTPHRPEELHRASKLHDPADPSSYEEEADEGTRQQEEGAPETSVEIRGGYEPGVEGDEREDQRQYAHLDKRDGPYTGDSLANVDLSEPRHDLAEEGSDEYDSMNVADLKDAAREQGVEGYSSMKRAELLEALRGR